MIVGTKNRPQSAIMILLRTTTSKILIRFNRHELEGLDLLTSGRGEGVFDPELVSILLATPLLADGVEFGDSDAMVLALTVLSLNKVTSGLKPVGVSPYQLFAGTNFSGFLL